MNTEIFVNKTLIIVLIISVILVLVFGFLGYQYGFKRGLNAKQEIVDKYNPTNSEPTTQQQTSHVPPKTQDEIDYINNIEVSADTVPPPSSKPSSHVPPPISN
ncbi:MAG: hypothetical protein ABH884_00130 [Candidatus Komeilibacteria bacterium]